MKTAIIASLIFLLLFFLGCWLEYGIVPALIISLIVGGFGIPGGMLIYISMDMYINGDEAEIFNDNNK